MKYLGAITDDKDLVTKEYVDDASEVVQTLTTGTKIGSVGGTDLYAPSGGGGGTKNIWYATCPTGSSTAQKVVTTDTGDFTLTAGNMLRVIFSNSNTTASPYLKVDSATTAYVRYVTGTSGAIYCWQAGEAVDFVYNGTYFIMVSQAPATTTYYGPTKLTDSTTSTSTTTAATPNSVKAVKDLVDVIGTRYSASSAVPSPSTDIDSPTLGAYVELPAGVYVVCAEWHFNTRSTTGTTNSEVALRYGTTGTIHAINRVFAAGNNWNSLLTVTTEELTQTTRIYVVGASSRAPNSTASDTNWINAVRIK